MVFLESNSNQGHKMPQRRYESLISSAAASGSAILYAHDQTRFSLSMATSGDAVLKYKILLYPTDQTADASAVTYADTTGSSAAAVALSDNLTDAQGCPFVFYKLKIEWSALATSNGGFGAEVACY
jgi:hypothetical protein